MRRIAIPSSAMLLFSLMFAAPVLAAAPANDVYTGRVAIGAIPFTDSLDTTEATTDADDAELNSTCGAPATDASVWYEIVGTDQTVLVDVSASDYSAGVLVGIGSPGSFQTVACGPFSVAFFAESGTTYALLIIDDQEDGVGTGGALELSVDLAPPPPEIEVTVDPTGTFTAQGGATITGTITCTADAFAFLNASLSQTVGRFTVRGFGFGEVFCDGSQQAWSIDIVGDTGLFKGGRATVTIFAQACTFDCGFAEVSATVRLRH
jgi:uncharacterized protein DUF6299